MRERVTVVKMRYGREAEGFGKDEIQRRGRIMVIWK